MARLGMVIDTRRCVGCMDCVVACKTENGTPEGMNRDWITYATRGKFPNLSLTIQSERCNHCDNPPCVDNCPTGALSKRIDGIVTLEQDRCVGCKYCTWSCPYGAPQFNPEERVMGKCDMCADYVDQGKNPSCVDACPMRALEFGDYDELIDRHGEPDQVYPQPDDSITRPSICVRGHAKAIFRTIAGERG